jgi:hypothetical protein
MTMFQTIKYFLVRTGISLFLLIVFGFITLYVVHEIALPRTAFDDGMIQWALLCICVFMGFFAYGQVGEQRFLNAFHALKDAGPLYDKEVIVQQFENLLRFTKSSYFLPGPARRFRGLVVRKYADYLLSIGQEEPKALKIYLKAFLQNPENSKFRAPLISILDQGGGLSANEIDLLLVMVRAEEFKDAFIVNHLASIFLRQKTLSGKTEPVFLYAVENKSKDAREILHFVIPVLLANQRADIFALRFYLRALPLNLPGEDEMRYILGKSYLEGHFEGIDPVLHDKCGQTFASIEQDRQAKIRQAIEANRISGRLKKINLFNREDQQDISRLKVRLGIEKSIFQKLADGIFWIGRLIQSLARKIFFKVIDGLILFGKARLWVKLVSISAMGLLILAGLGLLEWRANQNEIVADKKPQVQTDVRSPKPVATKPNKEHFIQIAAVTSSKHANRLINTLKRKDVTKTIIIKSARQSGGSWYKIRVGPFEKKNNALKLAKRMMDDKLIKNYFLVSTQKLKGRNKQG